MSSAPIAFGTAENDVAGAAADRCVAGSATRRPPSGMPASRPAANPNAIKSVLFIAASHHGHFTLTSHFDLRPSHLPHAGPGLPYQERLVGALARRVLLHAARSYFGRVEIAVLVRGKPVDAPLAALAGA